MPPPVRRYLDSPAVPVCYLRYQPMMHRRCTEANFNTIPNCTQIWSEFGAVSRSDSYRIDGCDYMLFE